MLTMVDIIRDGHPTLRQVASEVEIPPSDADIKTINKMFDFLKNSQDEDIAEQYELRAGVGLAAPQIDLSKRMIVTLFEDERERQYAYKLFNPKIVSHSVEKAYLKGGEGCLSVDENIPGNVPRYARITVEAHNEAGERVSIRLRGFAAIVFQHEIDHLNGIMFYDHIDADDPFKVPENAQEID